MDETAQDGPVRDGTAVAAAPAVPAPRDGAAHDARVRGLGEALLVTAVSVLVPGLAHLRSGRTPAGLALLIGSAVGATGLGLGFLVARDELPVLAVSPAWLLGLAVGAGVLAGLLVLLVVRSYAAVRPERLSGRGRIAGAAAVGVLCAAVAAPPLVLARYGLTQRDLVTSVFADTPAAPAVPVPAAGAGEPDAWAGVPRLNLLLLGGDADVGRPGTRTDSMTVASVDTRTGDTVLLSLPRNLQHVPVWDGRRRVPFAAAGLLNAVYQLGDQKPRLTGGRSRRPGAELLKRTVGHILGLPVHYYGLVDMRSFRQIVDAMGGVRVCVDKAVPVPRQQVASGRIGAGCRRLTGRQALWYGRSRTGSSDYSRMSRQKCLMWAISRQATPMTVLRSFQRLAGVFKQSVHTDLPRDVLPRLVALSAKVADADVRSVQFVPPLVRTGNPDYARIRKLAAQAVAGRSRHSAELHDLGRTCA